MNDVPATARPVMSDAQTMMLFESSKKSLGVSYALWFFLGMFGAHRFYAQMPGSAVVLIVLTLIGVASGGVLLIFPAIWALIDAFLIPGWIRKYNTELVAKLTGQTGFAV